MRVVGLSIVLLSWIQSPALQAQVTPGTLPVQGRSGEMERLRSELRDAQNARSEAGRNKARAYREAHELYKNCSRELRAFCLLSAQKLMRDADFEYEFRENHVTILEKAIAVLGAGAPAQLSPR